MFFESFSVGICSCCDAAVGGAGRCDIWCEIGGDIVAGDSDDDFDGGGDPFDFDFKLLTTVLPAIGVIGDPRCMFDELVSLASVLVSSRSLNSSELFNVSAASKDFLCIPLNESKEITISLEPWKVYYKMFPFDVWWLVVVMWMLKISFYLWNSRKMPILLEEKKS